MKTWMMVVLLSLSSVLHASDLQNGDVAKFDYREAPIFKILSVTKRVMSQDLGGVTYYSAKLNFHVIAEGNTCGGLRSTLGTSHHYLDDRIELKLLTGAAKVNNQTYCAEYSKPTRIVIPEILDLGTASPVTQIYDLGEGNVIVKWENKKLTTVIHNAE